MKLWQKVLIGIGATLLVLGGVIAIVIIADISWFLFVGIGVLALIIWVVIATILIYQNVMKKKPEFMKLDLENAEIMAKYMMAHDEDNPDNFLIVERRLYRVGEPGSDRTPIRILIGKGSELKEKRVVVINLEDPNETTMLIDPPEHEIERMAIKISKRQPEKEEREYIPGGVDYLGRSLPPRVITRKVSRSEAIKKEEEEKAKEEASF